MLYRTLEDGRIWMAIVVGGNTRMTYVSKTEYDLIDIGTIPVFGTSAVAMRARGAIFPGDDAVVVPAS